MIEWFYSKVKVNIMTFLKLLLSNFALELRMRKIRSNYCRTGGLQSLQAPMPSAMASRMVSSRRLLWVPQTVLA